MQSMVVIASHGDEVVDMPYGSENLAHSHGTENEVWCNRMTVLGVQTHPEFNEYCVEKTVIDKLHQSGKIDDFLRELALQ